MKWRRAGLSLLAYGLSLPLHAQWLGEHLDTSLSLRGDVWSGSRQLDDAGAIAQVGAWGTAKLDLEGAGKVVASGWVRDQSRADAGPPRGRVRELYWRHSTGPVEWRVGRQMIVWGRADGFNPTDNLSPRDFTLLAPEDGDLRYGNEAVQMTVGSGAGNLSAVWFPHAASHTLPLIALPNVTYAVERAPRRGQWALKWDMSGNAVDGSISYFNGTDPTPDLSIGGLAPTGLVVAVRSHPVRVLGADLSFTRSGIIWRAEGAWMRTESAGAQDFLHKKPQVWLVAGPEFSLGGNTTFGVQATLLHVQDYQDPDRIAAPIARAVAWRQAATSNQSAATQYGLTWRLAARLSNDALLAETNGVVTGPGGSGLWRTKLDYAVDDHLHFQTGTDYYFGPEHNLLGQLRRNRLIYVQARYGW